MKLVFKFSASVFILSFSLLVFISSSQCQPWYPPYSQGSYYQPYSSPPINININLGGFPGSSPMGYSPYPSSYMPYPSMSSGPSYLPAELLLESSVADGDYIYVLYHNMLRTGGVDTGEAGLAIFEASGSDDYDYVSRIAIFNVSADVAPVPTGIAVQDDLAVIGTFQGPVFFIDISDKDDPEHSNTLNISDGDKAYDYRTLDAGTLSIKDDVLFVVMSKGVMGEDAETTICAYDISDPDDTDEDDDLLDSYTLDNFDIHTMVIDSGYLYAAGNEDDDDEPSILVFDISDPEHISLEETFTDLDGDDYSRVNLAVNGDYLFATITLDQDESDYDDHGFKFKIINISDPLNPDLVYSSSKLEGVQYSEQKHIAFSDDHVFLATTIGDFGNWKAGGAWWSYGDEELFKCKVYVFDVSDPANADEVEISSKYEGVARGLYVVDSDRLCLHTDTELKIFDISDPTDLSLEGTVDIYDIMDGKLDDYYYSPPVYNGSPYNFSYPYRQSSYGGYNPYSNFNTYNNYSFYHGGYTSYPPYGGYSNYGYALPDYGGSYFGGYGFNTGYNSYGPGFGYGTSPFGGYPNYGYGTSYYRGGPYSGGFGNGYQPPYSNWW